MAISTQPTSLTAEYRYFIHDLVTNDFLVEVPFRGVSFGRSLREAGSFSADIPIIDATYNLDLYNNTLPGKRAIYVTRDGVCVWGGIIWSRNYNIKDKILSVQAAEFTSYLYHRTAWRTWANEYEAQIEILASGVGKATLTTGSFDFTANMPIYIVFGLDSNRKHDGYYYVVSDPAPTNEVIYFKRKDGTSLSDISERKDSASTIAVRQDTYQYTRDLLESMGTDFFDLEFPNSEIEPAAEFFQTIVSASRATNVATITLDAAHGLVVGQRVTITDLDLDASFNGRYIVTSITPNSFTYANTGPDVALTVLTPNIKDVTHIQRNSAGTVTLTTSSAHGFTVDDLVTVSDVNGSADGLHVITSVPSSTTFQYNTFYATEIAFSKVTTANTDPKATVAASVKFSTYGEFSANASLNIDYSTGELSEQDPRVNPIFRGSELKYVGEILDSYSNVQNGFEYRIDCSYDNLTKTFKRTFVFLPLIPNSLKTYLTGLLTVKSEVAGYYALPQDGNSVNDARKVTSTGLTYVWNGVAWVYTGGIGVLPAGTTAPPAAFGADRLVFEHPGNILDATLEESAEDSATRFWVQGVDDTGNSDASLPYAAETAIDYLKDGWPLLDQVEKVDEVSEEDTLYIHARQFLKEAKPPISYFSISINGSTIPEAGTFAPGDWCSVILDDSFVRLRLESPLEPNSNGILLRKIESFEIQVPDAPSLPEQINIQLISDGTIESIGGVRSSELGS
jgi:hypothetical protein